MAISIIQMYMYVSVLIDTGMTPKQWAKSCILRTAIL